MAAIVVVLVFIAVRCWGVSRGVPNGDFDACLVIRISSASFALV